MTNLILWSPSGPSGSLQDTQSLPQWVWQRRYVCSKAGYAPAHSRRLINICSWKKSTITIERMSEAGHWAWHWRPFSPPSTHLFSLWSTTCAPEFWCGQKPYLEFHGWITTQQKGRDHTGEHELVSSANGSLAFYRSALTAFFPHHPRGAFRTRAFFPKSHYLSHFSHLFFFLWRDQTGWCLLCDL